MKINNKNKIKTKAVLLILMIIASLSGVVFGIVTKFYQQSLGFLLLIPVALAAYSTCRLLNLKYFDYEHSGEVISIKYCHPWKTGRVTPAIELPQTKLASFDIKKSLTGKKTLPHCKRKSKQKAIQIQFVGTFFKANWQNPTISAKRRVSFF